MFIGVVYLSIIAGTSLNIRASCPETTIPDKYFESNETTLCEYPAELFPTKHKVEHI